VAEIAQADVVVLNGLGLEETLRGVIENNVGGDVPVVEMAQGLPVIEESHSDGDEIGNPHLWLNVRHAMRYVERVRDALVEVDPQAAEVYRSNADAYLEELSALDEEIATAMESIPVERRKLVTFHDAFPYFAERYGLEVVGVVVEAPGREPSPKELAQLVDRIRSEGVPAVFNEPQFAGTILEAVARDTGVEVKTLLTGSFAGRVESYIEMMRFDAQEIVQGLAK
jgi:ABC-type Zn uptake system ZnuABC Zn-binding protein ZnuA